MDDAGTARMDDRARQSHRHAGRHARCPAAAGARASLFPRAFPRLAAVDADHAPLIGVRTAGGLRGFDVRRHHVFAVDIGRGAKRRRRGRDHRSGHGCDGTFRSSRAPNHRPATAHRISGLGPILMSTVSVSRSVSPLLSTVRRRLPAPLGWHTRTMLSTYARHTFLATCAIIALAVSIDLTLFLSKVLAVVSEWPRFWGISVAWYVVLRATDFLAELLPLTCFVGVFWAEVVHTLSQERLVGWVGG